MSIMLQRPNQSAVYLLDDAGRVFLGTPRTVTSRRVGLNDFESGDFGSSGWDFGTGSFLPGTSSSGGGVRVTTATPATTSGFNWTQLFQFGQGVLNSVFAYKSAAQRRAPYIPVGSSPLPGAPGQTSVAFSSPFGTGGMSANTLFLVIAGLAAVVLLKK